MDEVEHGLPLRLDFASEDPEVRWQSHVGLIEHWLGPAALPPIKVAPDLRLPAALRRYLELTSGWPADAWGPFIDMESPGAIDAQWANRSDGYVAFASDNYAGFQWVTNDSGDDPPVWMVEWQQTVESDSLALSTSLIDELVRLSLQRFLHSGQEFVGARALQPQIADGSIKTEPIKFRESSGPFDDFALVGGDLLLHQVDVNGRAWSLVAARPGTAEVWQSLVDGRLSGVRLYLRPTEYESFRGRTEVGRWMLDINPDGSGHVQHGNYPRDEVRQWFAAGTVDVEALVNKIGSETDNDCRIDSFWAGLDCASAYIEPAIAEEAFGQVLATLDPIDAALAQRLGG